jgi:hypothetical protein
MDTMKIRAGPETLLRGRHCGGSAHPRGGRTERKSYTGFAINRTTGRTSTVDFTIERWSTDAQRDQLLQYSRGKGHLQANDCSSAAER